ncbi:MAG TPA: TonB-dependent receptor [Steroidobacteraceae bacterium]
MVRTTTGNALGKLTVAVIASSCIALNAEAQARSFRFDISNQSLSQALRSYGQICGEEIIFTEEVVAGARPTSLKGEFTTEEALRKLLEGTGLVAERSPSGALMILRPTSPAATESAPSSQSSTAMPESASDISVNKLSGSIRLAQADAPAAAPASDDAARGPTLRERETVVLEEIMIRGRRIDGLNNQGLLQSGENAALYHDVITSEDIERHGISSVEELFRLIPQTSSAQTSLQEPAGNVRTTGGLTNKASTIGLRGFSSSQTVVLINGRALPRSHIFSEGGADLGRIPIAAIERVEILPYAGSAIYGAGAIGGAINIVLRKNYSGHDLNTYLSTTTEGGGSEYRVTYVGGSTFNEGRTNLTSTVSFHRRNALRAGDRDHLDEALRRYGPDSNAVNAQGQSLFEQFIIPAFAGAPGTVVVGALPQEPINDLGIPGAPGVRYAAIPAGTTPEQATMLTPESFVDTAGQANLSPRFGRSILYEPIDSYNINLQWGHDLREDETLHAYGELTLGYNEKEYSAPQGIVLDLSATDPLNPFRDNVTPGFVGRPVRIYLDTPDLGDPSMHYQDEYARTVVGLKGRFNPRWEWSADAVVDYARGTVNSNNPFNNLELLTRLAPPPVVDPGPPADPETRRAVYPIFADHQAFPFPAADVGHYFDSIRYSMVRSLQWEGNARVLGTVFDLPAGPLQTSLVGKYQYWDFHYGQRTWTGDGFSQLINNAPATVDSSRTPATRRVVQGGIEISIPIISNQWRPIPIRSLELQGSLSRERHVSSSVNQDDERFSDTKSASSGVIAARMQVTQDVAFRASWSEGFYPPDWQDVGMPVTTFTLPGFFPDPARGNTLQFFTPGAPMIEIQQGGNPDLKPETARSWNFGMMLTPRFAPGLSLHVDYWKIEKVDGVISTSFVDIIANPDAFGFLITRAPPSESDIANGWLGFITAVDARAFNASVIRTQGVDLQLKYTLDTAFGTFDFTGGGSITDKFDVLATPSSPSVDTVSGSGPLRRRANGSLTWSKRNWWTTLTGRYTGWRWTPTTAPSPSYPGAFALDGDRIPSSLLWDLQIGYERPLGSGSEGRVAGLLDGTRITLGAINLFNEEPAFVSDGYSFYNGVEDPRQRVVYLQVRKSF